MCLSIGLSRLYRYVIMSSLYLLACLLACFLSVGLRIDADDGSRGFIRMRYSIT